MTSIFDPAQYGDIVRADDLRVGDDILLVNPAYGIGARHVSSISYGPDGRRVEVNDLVMGNRGYVRDELGYMVRGLTRRSHAVFDVEGTTIVRPWSLRALFISASAISLFGHRRFWRISPVTEDSVGKTALIRVDQDLLVGTVTLFSRLSDKVTATVDISHIPHQEWGSFDQEQACAPVRSVRQLSPR